jgi:integrase-like protein
MILSQEEVAHLINSARTPFHRIVLMTLYATGVRLARLKISDIDSQRMVIHIRGGKGGKDRGVMLSPLLLDALRRHWRGLKRKPTQWLFPGGGSHTADRPITPKAVYYACLHAARRAGLQEKKVHPTHIAPLSCQPPAGERRRSAHHSTSAGASRSGRDHHLPASFPTPSRRHRKPARRTGTVIRKRETPDTAEALHKPASLGDGRCHPHCWTALH